MKSYTDSVEVQGELTIIKSRLITPDKWLSSKSDFDCDLQFSRIALKTRLADEKGRKLGDGPNFHALILDFGGFGLDL